MIIGNGNIAKALTDKPNVIYFASGVSDSGCTDPKQFTREKDMFIMTRLNFPDHHIVYFSSLGIYRWTNPYIEHKKQMEEIVRQGKHYTIVRVEVIDWGTNPNTILNYFKRKIQANELVTIQDTYRAVISLNEFQYWMNYLPTKYNAEVNITGKLYHVADLYQMCKEGKI